MVQPSEPSQRPAGGGLALRRREIAGLAAMLLVLGVVLALVIRGPAAAKAPGGATTSRSARFEGLTVTPTKPAPPLALRSYLGVPVNIDRFRGRAVLVTFLYTHCPDICPLITSMLHTALARMPAGERARLAVIAVSVDPRGDTPGTVARFLAAHEMTGQMQYLIGSAPTLGAVWTQWGVGSKRDAGSPELVAHTALVYGITAHGRIATVYPSNFTPAEIVHDVRLLASA